MSAVVKVRGQVRGLRDLRKKPENGFPGEIFAREISLLTEQGEHLGETLKVLAWNSDHGGVVFTPGDVIDAVVDIAASRFGLEAKLLELVAVPDVRALHEAEFASR